jgi:hypothetical protein
MVQKFWTTQLWNTDYDKDWERIEKLIAQQILSENLEIQGCLQNHFFWENSYIDKMKKTSENLSET